MIENELTITLNRSSDLRKIEEILKGLKIQSPVFIMEFEDRVNINFTSDYEYYELNTAIENEFNGYELTQDVGNGRKEIRLKISRYQSPMSTDGWGRRLEDSVDETLYLMKKSQKKPQKLNPRIKVLFEDVEQEFIINIVRGKSGDEKQGFLILDSFDYLSVEERNEKTFYNKLYPNVSDAYHTALSYLTEFAAKEFQEYLKVKKSQKRKK